MAPKRENPPVADKANVQKELESARRRVEELEAKLKRASQGSQQAVSAEVAGKSIESVPHESDITKKAIEGQKMIFRASSSPDGRLQFFYLDHNLVPIDTILRLYMPDICAKSREEIDKWHNQNRTMIADLIKNGVIPNTLVDPKHNFPIPTYAPIDDDRLEKVYEKSQESFRERPILEVCQENFKKAFKKTELYKYMGTSENRELFTKICTYGQMVLESKFEGNLTSNAGAQGPWQILPSTWDLTINSQRPIAKKLGLTTHQSDPLQISSFDAASLLVPLYYNVIFTKLKPRFDKVAKKFKFKSKSAFVKDFVIPALLASYHAGEEKVGELIDWALKNLKKEDFGRKPYGADIFNVMQNRFSLDHEVDSPGNKLYGRKSRQYHIKAMAYSELMHDLEQGTLEPPKKEGRFTREIPSSFKTAMIALDELHNGIGYRETKIQFINWHGSLRNAILAANNANGHPINSGVTNLTSSIEDILIGQWGKGLLNEDRLGVGVDKEKGPFVIVRRRGKGSIKVYNNDRYNNFKINRPSVKTKEGTKVVLTTGQESIRSRINKARNTNGNPFDSGVGAMGQLIETQIRYIWGAGLMATDKMGAGRDQNGPYILVIRGNRAFRAYTTGRIQSVNVSDIIEGGVPSQSGSDTESENTAKKTVPQSTREQQLTPKEDFSFSGKRIKYIIPGRDVPIPEDERRNYKVESWVEQSSGNGRYYPVVSIKHLGKAKISGGFMEPNGHGMKDQEYEVLCPDGKVRKYGKSRMNIGVDYVLLEGAELKSWYDGEVVHADLNGEYGYRVIIKTKKTIQYKGIRHPIYQAFGHMQSNLQVVKGEKVRAGQPIGFMGTTGSGGRSGQYPAHVDIRSFILPQGVVLGDQQYKWIEIHPNQLPD